MRFKISFGIQRGNFVQDLTLLGVRWSIFQDRVELVELHLLGLIFFFDFQDTKFFRTQDGGESWDIDK